MKEFNLKKWIIRFIILACMFTVYDMVMNVLDEVYLRLVNEQALVDKSIDVDSFFTMHDLGYEYHEVTEAQIKKQSDFTLDPNVLIFDYSLNNDDINNSVRLDFVFYRFSTEEVKDTVFNEFVPHVLENYEYTLIYIGNNLKKPNYTFETATQTMTKLDSTLWNVDLGYAVKDPFTTNFNRIIVQKDNKIMLMTYSGYVPLTTDHATVIGSLMDKVDSIFDAYGKE